MKNYVLLSTDCKIPRLANKYTGHTAITKMNPFTATLSLVGLGLNTDEL